MNQSSILDKLIPHFERDPRYHLLVCDNGFGAVDRIKAAFPDRVINAGIKEQATVGIAAGMAMAGKLPIVYSIANFLVYRALEQIRNDIVMHSAPVHLIAKGAGDYFKELGRSHTCGTQDIDLMAMVGMPVYCREDFDKWIAQPFAYLRN